MFINLDGFLDVIVNNECFEGESKMFVFNKCLKLFSLNFVFFWL